MEESAPKGYIISNKVKFTVKDTAQNMFPTVPLHVIKAMLPVDVQFHSLTGRKNIFRAVHKMIYIIIVFIDICHIKS